MMTDIQLKLKEHCGRDVESMVSTIIKYRSEKTMGEIFCIALVMACLEYLLRSGKIILKKET